MLRPVNEVEFKKNLIANGFPEVPVVVEIPVIIPENPSTVSISIIFSYETLGVGARTNGGFEVVYPNPGLVTDAVVIIPAVIDAVAVAVVPTPTPIDFGAEMERVTEDPVYPDPPSTTDSEVIVPAAETTAVIAAATGSLPETIRAFTSLITIDDSFSS